MCDGPKESRGVSEGIKSNLALVTNSIFQVMCVFVCVCMCKRDINSMRESTRVRATLAHHDSWENPVKCFHCYAKVTEDCELGCCLKWVSSILRSSSSCPSTKEPLEPMRMGERFFFFFLLRPELLYTLCRWCHTLRNKIWRWSPHIYIAGDNGIPGHIFMV